VQVGVWEAGRSCGEALFRGVNPNIWCFSIRLELFLFPQGRSERDADQQALGGEKPAYGLTPRFPLVLNEHSMSQRFQIGRGFLHIFHFKFEPRLRDGTWSGQKSLPKQDCAACERGHSAKCFAP
jgi:hypothetical protein